MSIAKYLLDMMTVQELRQYARNHGMSSITRLDMKASLIPAILRYETKRDGRGVGACCEMCYAPAAQYCVTPYCGCHSGEWVGNPATEAPKPASPSVCNCFPHGPGQPCTCDGCPSCTGHVMGCTCDIVWDSDHGTRKPYRATRWALGTRTDAWAWEARRFEGECYYCGVWLRTEADLAKHFIITDHRYRNTGDCPNKLAGAPDHNAQMKASSHD